MNKNIIAACAFMLFAANASAASPVPPFLNGSLFHKAYSKTDIDPVLLYSISLTESAYKRDNHNVGPTALALRYNGKSYYLKSETEAKEMLSRWLDSGAKNIDVGLMQVNILWNGHRVNSPFDLLNPEINLSVASDILLDAMRSSPNDVRLAIGRYHNWKDEERALAYADRVLRIYTKINQNR